MSQFGNYASPAVARIPDVIEEELNRRGLRTYSGQARPVAEVLVQREQAITNGIIQRATQAGMSQAQVTDILRDLGCHLPETTTEPFGQVAQQPSWQQPQQGQGQPGQANQFGGYQGQQSQAQQSTGDPVMDALNRIQADLQGLSQFARENGYTG